MMLELQEIGCHNINWITPEHVVAQILEALPLAVVGGLQLPIVYNTSAYDSPDSLALMDGVVDVYMPDLKLVDSERTRRYLGKREYFEVASRNVLEMQRQVGDLALDEQGLARRGLIVRHLVMPGLLDETEAVLRLVAEQLGPGTYVNLMGQYSPGRQDRAVPGDRPPPVRGGACARLRDRGRPWAAPARSAQSAADRRGALAYGACERQRQAARRAGKFRGAARRGRDRPRL